MSKDTCIKANTYCPVHKGIVGADCWHDSKDFSVPRTDWKQVDEINTLREQVEKLKNRLNKDSQEFTILCAKETEKVLREQLAALAEQNEKMRKVLLRLACLGNGDQYGNSIGNCIAQEALSLPNLATPLLNRIRAEGVRKASTLVSLVRNDWASAGDNLSVQAAEYLISALDARAAELEKTNG